MSDYIELGNRQKKDKDLKLSEKTIDDNPQSRSYEKDVAKRVHKKQEAYFPEVLKKRGIKRKGDIITPKKQVEIPPAKISDKLRKQNDSRCKTCQRKGKGMKMLLR